MEQAHDEHGRAGRRRAPRLRAVVGGSLAVAVIAALITVRMPADATETGPTPQWDPVALADLADLVAAAPDEFAGASVDPKTGAVTVRYPSDRAPATARAKVATLAARTNPGGAGARVTAAGAAARPVTYAATKYSTSELTSVKDRITSDRSWLPDADRLLTGWWIDVPTNTVTVSLTEITPAAVAAAERTFGDRVRLVEGGRARQHSRLFDTEPYAGGSVIFNEAELGCATAFAVERTNGSGQRGLLTAGHCFTGNGEDVVTFEFDPVGVIAEHQDAQNGLDRAVVTGRTYRPEVYIGGQRDDVETTIIGSVGLLPGMRVCSDGPITLQNCTGIVDFVDACFSFQGGKITCDISGAQSSNGSRLGNEGDSGGPVIMYQNAQTNTGPAFAMGMIVGGGPDGTGRQLLFHRMAVVIPSGWRLVTSG